MDAIGRNERRTVKRNSGKTINPVRIRLPEGDIVASVHDISVMGIGILASQNLQVGAWHVLEPTARDGRLVPELKAEVRHIMACGIGEYLVGCQFSRLLTVEDMMALG